MKSAASPNSDNATSPNSDDAVYPLGTKLVNFFPGHGWYSGTIQAVDNHKYTVVYDDGDLEEFLIEGPTMDALVELAKSRSSLCLGDTTPVPAMTICPPASMCAAKQGSSVGGSVRKTLPRKAARGTRRHAAVKPMRQWKYAERQNW
ncbi:hypothetical protein MHU86_11948 [Fragilaria crotonensis]|nr:hypothetical protein MHU86_11948 [Fragilaria crotonensis]